MEQKQKLQISFTTRDIYGCLLIYMEHISENVEVMIHIFSLLTRYFIHAVLYYKSNGNGMEKLISFKS